MSELRQNLKNAFADLKKERGLTATFEEIDSIFFIQDFIDEKGYVSTSFSRQLCSRMVGLFQNWHAYLHGIVMPNPSSLPAMTEHQLFSEEERSKITQLMSKYMEYCSRSGIIGISKNETKEGQFIDDGVALWNETKSEILTILERVNANYAEKATQEFAAPRKDRTFG